MALNDLMYGESGTGFMWLYGIITAFGIGIIELIIMPIIKFYVYPAFVNIINTNLPTESADLIPRLDFVIDMMHYGPYVCLFAVFIYLIISANKKEQVQYYG